MKKLGGFVLILFLLIACRQNSEREHPVLRSEGMHTLFDTTGAGHAIATVMNQFSQAYNSSDTTVLKDLLSADFLMITGIADYSFFTRDEFLTFIKESKDTANIIDLKTPFNYLPGPRKIYVAYTGLAAAAQDSVSFLNIRKQQLVMNMEHYGAVYLNAFLKKDGEKWQIHFISLYPVLKNEK